MRQLRRERALEVETLEGLRVPTLAEMARIKSWMLLERNTVRDDVDTVALLEKLGERGVPAALASFDAVYGRGPGGGPPLVELVERLAEASPVDRASVDLETYKGLTPPWRRWDAVEERARRWAARLAANLLGCPGGGSGGPS